MFIFLKLNSNKSNTCDWATMFLNENGIEAVNLHGDMSYEMRIGKFKQYQDGIVNIMVSTDVGSRGLNTIRVSDKNLINLLNVYNCCNNFGFRLNML